MYGDDGTGSGGTRDHDERRLRAGLSDLAPDPDDEGVLDTVVSRGRALKRRRKATRVGTAVLAVAMVGAVAFGVVRLAQHLGDEPGQGGWTSMGAPAAGGETTSTTTAPATPTYINRHYGFTFTLPESWEGYTIVEETWTGTQLEAPEGSYPPAVIGPEILIRHPLWTESDPHQDIPIMVFTLEQWDLVQTEKLGVGAAPIPPSELGRNATYVFALPARYNFAFLTGWEEVEQILQGHPLQPLTS
jgi:hypothetical protein